MDNCLQWFKTEARDGRTYVFDPLRRRYVVLTPEEEVRQKVLYLLVEHLKVPAGLVAVEYSVKVRERRTSADDCGVQGSHGDAHRNRIGTGFALSFRPASSIPFAH